MTQTKGVSILKKNISCILALVLIINLFSSSVTVYAATASCVTANIETVNMGTFVKAFTDADMANNFENYAASGSAIDFSDISNMPASIVQPNENAENYFANVVGTVYDKETGEVLPGTQVLIDALGVSITTDQRGRFSIENVPVGEYNRVSLPVVLYDRKGDLLHPRVPKGLSFHLNHEFGH